MSAFAPQPPPADDSTARGGVLRRAARARRVRRPKVVVNEVGAAFVLRAQGNTDTDVDRLATALPNDVPSIVVDRARAEAGDVRDKLGEFVATLGRRGVRTVRVVPKGSLPVDGDDWWPRLAARTGVELLVASGRVSTAHGAPAFVQGTQPGTAGTWWRYEPGKAAVAIGARQPAPHWQRGPVEEFPRSYGSLVAQPVPAGVFLRPSVMPPDGAWSSALSDPDRLTVFVGSPSGPYVLGEEVAAYLTTLPAALRHEVRLVCGAPQDVVALGRIVADALGRDVIAVNGVPHGELGVALVDDTGTAVREPYVTEIRCHAEDRRPAAPHRWRAPVADLAEHTEPGVYVLGPGWLVHLTRGGFWLRGAGLPVPSTAMGTPVQPAVVDVAIGDPGSPLPDSVWTILPSLLDRLEPATLRRVRLTVHGTPSAAGRSAAIGLAALRALPVHLAPAATITTATTGTTTTATATTGPATTGAATTDAATQSPKAATSGRFAARTTTMRATLARTFAASTSDHPAELVTEVRNPEGRTEPTDEAQASPDAGPPATPAVESPAAPVAAPMASSPPESSPLPPAAGSPADDVAVPVVGTPVPPVAQTVAAGPRDEVIAAPPVRAQVPVAPVRPTRERPAVPLIHPDHRSTAHERELCKETLGDRYEVHLSRVTGLLARTPVLRNATGDDRDAAKADFVALRAYLSERSPGLGREALDAALRGDAGPLLPFAACVTSGLRRLPAHRGLVRRGVDLSSMDISAHHPGMVLVVPAPVAALARRSCHGDTDAEYAIWSVTGRRAGLLLEADADEVVFPPGSRFAVVDVEVDAATPTVLLAELPRTTRSGAVDDPRSLAETAAKLRAALRDQDTGPRADQREPWPGWCRGPVGSTQAREETT